MSGQLLNPTDRDIDPAQCRKRSQFYRQFGTTSKLSSASLVCYTCYRPCHRHNSGSLPSVKNRNYLGRSVPPAVLFKHYGRADTHGWYWENCHDQSCYIFPVVCFVFKRRSQNSSYLAQISLCLDILTDIQNISSLYSTDGDLKLQLQNNFQKCLQSHQL